MLRRAFGILLRLLLTAPFAVWGMLAFAFGAWSPRIDYPLAALYGVAHLAAVLFLQGRRAWGVCGLLFLLPLAAFFLMRPSNERPWQPDVAAPAYAEIEGDQVTVHNVRYCDYRTEVDYTPRYETRTYDLKRLRSADVLFSDWGVGYIAHTLISFGFEGGQYLCVSVETRKEIGESYSALKGFFRQYELMYVLGDERDLVRLRTNFREGENVYLYRLRVASANNLRRTFLEFMARANRLHARPEWYNALTSNCMTDAFRVARKNAIQGRGRWHWSVILNGYSAQHAYENGVIDSSLPFDELKTRSLVNSRAQASDFMGDFSANIRAGIPGMDWVVPADQGVP